MININEPPRLHIRIVFGPKAMIGPGKAALLDQIAQKGSISAAGRAMGMSYKRAWMLIEDLNAMFRDPLVESSRGGPGGGGALLTPNGKAVLNLYRQVQNDAAFSSVASLMALSSLLKDQAIEE
ncbi:winged helix-turn-helix domain-containing protein [Iodidimonas nitroreducens]|nr:LysR family transcriptional regulator [Iodidimonas nitroreducens]